jgi:hypothetical protein
MRFIALAALLLALTAPTAAAAAGSDDEVPKLKGTLTYARTGGLAGVDDRLRIKRDGWSLLDGREFRLRPVEREAVAKLVEEAKLERAKVTPKPAVPDAFVHTLTYRKHTITFDDPSTPKKVKKLRDLLGRLIAKYDET